MRRILLALVCLLVGGACRLDLTFDCQSVGDRCGVNKRCVVDRGQLQCRTVIDAGADQPDGSAADGGATGDGGSATDGGDAGSAIDGGDPADGGSSNDGGHAEDDGGHAKDDGGHSQDDGGSNTDGGATVDGGSDGGSTTEDGGAADGGSPDGGASDGGAFDGGASDGGASDGGASDGGIVIIDGGTLVDGGTAIDGGTTSDGGIVIDDGGVVIDDGGVQQDGGTKPDGGATPCQAVDSGNRACAPISTAQEAFAALCGRCPVQVDGAAIEVIDPACKYYDGGLSVAAGQKVVLDPGCHLYANVSVAPTGTLEVKSQNTTPTVIFARGTFVIGGVVDASGQGFLAGTGPGAGSAIAGIGAGAGHGGVGGDGAGVAGGPAYGDPCLPLFAGSGGGFDGLDPNAGRGGGTIALIAGATFTFASQGAVNVKGLAGALPNGGGGAGGSVTLAGFPLDLSGEILASGGNGQMAASLGGGGGAGGRIRFIGPLSPVTASSFGARIDARGGLTPGGGWNGRPGTFYSDAWPAIWVVRGGAALLPQPYSFASLSLSDSGTVLTLKPDLDGEMASFLHTGALTVPAGTRLASDGEGFPGGDARGPGVGEGDTFGGGGGFGGRGGDGANGRGGESYGSASLPVEPGSGGAGRYGGAGGGSLLVCVDGTLTLGGEITANGEGRPSLPSYAAGSGGSIFVEVTGTLSAGPSTTGGKFRARGGTPGSDLQRSGAGGGGRIRVIAPSTTGRIDLCDVSPGRNEQGDSAAQSGTAICP